jgi:hypothetical protein
MQDTVIQIAQIQWRHQGREFLPWIHYGADKADISIGPSGDLCPGMLHTE